MFSAARKRRKFPLSPYKGKWHQTFDQQQALENLKRTATEAIANQNQSPETLRNDVISAVTNSFRIHGCHPNPSAYSFLINLLSRNAKTLFTLIPPILDHLERAENFETPERIFVDLIRSYAVQGMDLEAVELFLRIPKFRCNPTVYSLNTLLVVLSRKKEGLLLIPDVLVKSAQMKIRLEESCFRILVKSLCRIGKFGYAIEILNLMKSSLECVPDQKLYSETLLLICKNGNSVEALKFLEEMQKAEFRPDRLGYGNVIDVLVKDGEVMKAFHVLNQMKLEGMKPDIISYTSVLDGLFSAGEFQRGDELFDEILVMGLVPDVFTYSVYINGLCKRGEFSGAIRFLGCMEEAGCRPDMVAYNTILAALCKVGDMARAREVMSMMSLKGIKGNLHTYRNLLGGFLSKGEIDEACGLLEQMLKSGLVPVSSTFDSIICGLCQQHLLSEASQVLREMVNRSVIPGPRAWEALISCMLLESSSIETFAFPENNIAAT